MCYGPGIVTEGDMDNTMRTVRTLLSEAESVVALTGAGISAESGVPTFRGEDGLWRGMDPMKLATPQAFEKDPALVWEFYTWRRKKIHSVSFNAAHKALARMEKKVDEFTLVSQNVDGLHQQAGSRNVLEIHGSIWKTRCTQCGRESRDRKPDLGRLPACTVCNGLLRPGVVWFNEPLDQEIWEQSARACVSCQVMLVIGTSSVVQPAASLALAAKSQGAILVEVNLEPTPQTDSMDFILHGKAGDIVPRLVP